MARLYVLQTGRTAWEDQSRFEPAAGTPLTEEGLREAASVLEALPAGAVAAVYAGPGEPEHQVGGVAAKRTRVKLRVRKELHELDYGLWQGLTHEEIQRRQPKVFRQWSEDPAAVRPPGGETLEEAQKRLRRAVRRILGRHKGEPPLLVLRPVAAGLLRSLLSGQGIEGFWRHREAARGLCEYEIDGDGESL
jgi:probable phosphoglycerate mutase